MTELPSHVLARLGPAPTEVSGAGEARVLRGGGYVAKSGPVSVITPEAEILRLGPSLPIEVPPIVEVGDEWLLAADVDDRAGAWTNDELMDALADLAALHEAFVTSALLARPWLRRPFGADLDGLLALARHARPPLPAPLTALLADPAPLLTVLHGQPRTLLHGDPWPANIRRPAPGRRVWVDWEQASVGPAAADVATWLDQTPWHLGHAIDDDAHLARYLAARKLPPDEHAFRDAVAAASIVWFFAFDAPNLDDAPAPTVTRLVERAEHARARLDLD